LVNVTKVYSDVSEPESINLSRLAYNICDSNLLGVLLHNHNGIADLIAASIPNAVLISVLLTRVWNIWTIVLKQCHDKKIITAKQSWEVNTPLNYLLALDRVGTA